MRPSASLYIFVLFPHLSDILKLPHSYIVMSSVPCFFNKVIICLWIFIYLYPQIVNIDAFLGSSSFFHSSVQVVEKDQENLLNSKPNIPLYCRVMIHNNAALQDLRWLQATADLLSNSTDSALFLPFGLLNFQPSLTQRGSK